MPARTGPRIGWRAPAVTGAISARMPIAKAAQTKVAGCVKAKWIHSVTPLFPPNAVLA